MKFTHSFFVPQTFRIFVSGWKTKGFIFKFNIPTYGKETLFRD